MEKIVLNTSGGNYAGLYKKGTTNNDVAIVYYHGLNGKSKVVQPLIKKFDNYDFYSMEERGHADSLQKPSISPKKHDKDIYNVISYLKQKYKYVFLCGESMGALFASRYAYKYENIDGVFTWSIPFYPKDIMKVKKSKKIKIIIRVILCFLFSINYKYISEIDYPKLTNSKFLMKLHELEIKTEGSTAEEIAIWKASFKTKKLLLNKKPKAPLFYWQGENDIMSNQKIIKKIQKKNLIYSKLIPEAKHILMFENGAEVIWNEMDNFIKLKINKSKN